MIRFSDIPSDKFYGRLLRWMLMLMPKRMAVPIMQGPAKGLRWIVGSQTHGMWLGSYEASKQELLRKLKLDGCTVLDIGANVGFYSMLLSRLVGPSGRVLSFEPLPRNVYFLNRHIILNRINNIEVYEAAVSDFNGRISFDASGDPSMGHLAENGTLKVSAMRLDSLTELDSSARLVKIDVEGAEESVLRGGQKFFKTQRPVILLATHGQYATEACRELLKSYGYSFEPLDRNAVEEDCGEWVCHPLIDTDANLLIGLK